MDSCGAFLPSPIPALQQSNSYQMGGQLPVLNELHLQHSKGKTARDPKRHQMCSLILLPVWWSAKLRRTKSLLQNHSAQIGLFGEELPFSHGEQNTDLLNYFYSSRSAKRAFHLTIFKNYTLFLKLKEKRQLGLFGRWSIILNPITQKISIKNLLIT